MKKFTVFIILVALIVIGVFYFTKPSHAPVEEKKDHPEEMTVGVNDRDGFTTLAISKEESNIEFSIGEVLRGEDFIALGETNNISGNVYVKDLFDGTYEISIGEMLVDAREFKTDSENRDRAISGFILRSRNNPDFNFIKFTPDENTIKVKDGEEIKKDLFGNLTISGVTNRVVFSLTLAYEEGSVKGQARTKLSRKDFGLEIPNVAFVASVNDEFDVSVNVLAK